MKKNLLSIVAAVIATLMYTPSTAQFAINNNPKAVDSYEKNVPSSAMESKVAAAEVDARTRQDFAKKFADANEVTWTKKGNGFVAMFNQAATRINVAYRAKGRWVYTVKRYVDENILPKNVRAQVKSTYDDYKILHIEEITVPENENIIYLLILLDGKKQKTLRVCDGEMDVINEIERG
jgi:Putative beta-lactamase-inhibitor-like, PepSY-like